MKNSAKFDYFSIALFISMTGALSAQSLADFDLRDQYTVAEARGPQRGVAAERASRVERFVAVSNATMPGLHIQTNRFGLPKVMLRDGGYLSAPSGADAERIARDFLANQAEIVPLTQRDLNGLRVSVYDKTTEATFLTYTQTIGGVPVFEGHIKFTLSKDGSIAQASVGEIVPGLGIATTPALSEADAFAAARRGLRAPALSKGASAARSPSDFSGSAEAEYRAVTTELTIFPISAETARLAYRFIVDAAGPWYETLVDANNGDILFRHALAVHAAQGNVWTVSPLVGQQQLTPFPSGWLPATGLVTTGNNADVYLDANGDGKPDNVIGNPDFQNGRAYSATQNFSFTFGDGTVNKDPRL